MKQFGKLVLTALGAAGLAAGLSALPSQPASGASSGAPVFVTNPGSSPVPVVYPSTPTVNAAQSGTWNVNVANAPNVNIANTPSVSLAAGSSVRDADNPALSPAVVNGSLGQGCNLTADECVANLYQVPNGKRLVVEYLSATACLPVGQTVQIGIANSSSESVITPIPSGTVFLTMSPAAIAGESGFVCDGNGTTSVGQSVRFYVDAGNYLVGFAQRNKGDVGSGSVLFWVSGYLVNVP